MQTASAAAVHAEATMSQMEQFEQAAELASANVLTAHAAGWAGPPAHEVPAGQGAQLQLSEAEDKDAEPGAQAQATGGLEAPAQA